MNVECQANLENGILTLENDRIRRTYVWNGGYLIGREIVDKADGRVWHLDCAFPGLDVEPAGGELAVVEQPASAYLTCGWTASGSMTSPTGATHCLSGTLCSRTGTRDG